MRYLKQFSNRFIALLILLGLVILLIWPSFVQAMPLTAMHRLQNAWALANSVGVYQYRTDLIQTIHPTERLENMGRSSKSKRMVVEGETNRHDNFMQMTMAGQTGSAGVIEIKVEDGQSFGRLNASDEWTALEEDTSDVFAPGGDPLGFLVAAENVQEEANLSPEALGLLDDELGTIASNPDLLLPLPRLGGERGGLTRYTFDLNGVKYAEFMRDQLEEELRRKGELPAGINLGLAQQYVEMEAEGEIWVNDEGLPVRQMIHLKFPAEKGAMNWVSADITTDFTDWGETSSAFSLLLPRLIDNPSLLIEVLGARKGHPYDEFLDNFQQLGINLGLMLLISGLVLLLIRHRESRKLYAAFSMAVIISMVFSPLMRMQPVYAFNERQIARQAEQQANIEQQDEQEALTDEIAGRDFNPHVKQGTAGRGNPLRLPTTLPADRDNPLRLLASNNANSCMSNTDTDGDGLSDNIECYELGTWVDDIDTDGDFISDYAEVTGFQDDSGRWWYLDPRNPDSNGDGLNDTVECPELGDVYLDNSGNELLDTGVTYADCADTDGDEMPDVFDYDNDGDGVPDKVDASPFDYVGDLSTGLDDQAFSLKLDNLDSSSNAVLVDFEVRPTNADNLWHANQVLNWPSNDTEGQIQRKMGNSTADTWLDFDSSSPDASADHGDLRLMPMLEIEITYSSSNPSAGLPITDSLSNNTTDIPDYSDLDWLNTDILDEYGISVNYDPDDGQNLWLYLPLTVIKDEVGETPVTFSTRMVYEATANWGSAHEVRLMWMVNALMDACDTSVMPDEFTSQEGKTINSDDADAYELWCAYDQYDDDGTTIDVWQTEMAMIQRYYDDFYLSGLSVREDHGLSVTMIAQKDTSTAYESDLWSLSDKLQNNWLAGLNDNSSRFDVFDLNETYNSYISDGSLYMEEISLDNQVALVEIATTYNQQVLNNAFSSPAEGQAATLLYAGEESYRSMELASDLSTMIDNQVTFDFTNSALNTYGHLRSAPFLYESGTWNNVDDLQAYFDDVLALQLGNALTDAVLTQILSGQALQNRDFTQAGAIQLAQNYYLALYVGSLSLLESDGSGATDQSVANNLATLDSEPLVPILQEMLTNIQAYYERISVSVAIGTDLEANTITWQTLATSASTLLMSIGEAQAGISSSYTLALQQLTDYYKTTDFNTQKFLIDMAVTPIGIQIKQAIVEAGGYYVSVSYVLIMGAKSIWSINSAINTYRSISTLASQASGASSLTSVSAQMRINYLQSTSKWSILGLVLVIAIAVIPFVVGWATGAFSINDLAFTQNLAYVYAQIVVAVLYFILASNPVGAIISAVIGLIDLLITIVCGLVDTSETVQQWVCGGITGAITQALVYVLFDQTPLVNLTKKNRLDFAINRMTLVDENQGFTAGNQINIGGVITSSLYFNTPTSLGWTYWYQFSDSNLKKSNFDYQFQAQKNNISLSNTDWQIPDGRSSGNGARIPSNKRFYEVFERSNKFTLNKMGINQPLDIYLTERFEMNAQECWNVLGVPVCYLRDNKDSTHTNLSQNFLFDIFPATFSEFVEMALVEDNSYRLAWDEQFPMQWDADGDGLVSQNKGGADPDDNKPDFDADGLSDFWEYSNGYDMTDADGDNDGLTDYWEAFYDTNPNLADTDGDGLIDGDEVFHPNKSYPYENDAFSDGNPTFSGGWTIVYEYDDAGNPLETLVQANPLDVDTDDDGILDKFEYIYGYNPTVPNALNVLSLNSSVDTTLVKPADTLDYDAEITNELDNRYASGLLESEFPIDVVQERQVIDTLAPLESISMTGSVDVPTVTASQNMSLTVRAGAVIEDLETDRTLWLRFNESTGSTTFADDSLEGHDATCPDSATCPTANGSYLTFDGSDDQLPLPQESLGDLDAYSFGMWIYPQSDGLKRLVRRDKYFDLFTFNGTVIVDFDKRSCGQQKGSISAITQTQLTTERWHHIFVTMENETPTIYINGLADSTWSSNSDGSSYQGCQPSTYFKLSDQIFPFQGRMDGVEFYDRALSAAEVHELVLAPILDLDMESLVDQSSTKATVSTITTIPALVSNGRSFTDDESLKLSNDGLALDNSAFTFALWLAPEQRSYRLNEVGDNVENNIYGTTYDWQTVFGYEEVLDTDGDNSYETLKIYYPSLGISDQGHVRIRFGRRGNLTSWCEFQTASPILSFNSRQHLVISFDTTLDQYLLYLNGSLVASGGTNCTNANPLETQSQFYLGRTSLNGYIYLDESDVYWPVFNNFYHGILYDFKIYNYSLSDEQVAELYNSSFYALKMPFDEPPGKDTFSDFSGNAFEATCDSSNNSCPDSGIPGRDNQALRFDGDVLHDEDRDTTPDYLILPDADTLGLKDESFTVMAWIKLDDLTDDNTILGTETRATNKGLHLTIRDGKPRFAFYNNGTGSSTILETDRWYHIAWVYNKNNQTQTIYLDGTRDVVGTNKAAFQGTDPVWVGRWGNEQIRASYFDGMIDQLLILRSALTRSQVRELMAQTPLLNLHLDESINTATFTDESTLSNDATCSGDSCPSAGDKGQMREAAVFDGQNDMLIVPDQADYDLEQFTLGAWVKPRAIKSSRQALISKENDDGSERAFGLYIAPDSLHVSLHVFVNDCSTNRSFRSNTEMIENQWNHVMATYDGSQMALYINGALSNSRTVTGTPCQNDQPIKIGDNEVSNFSPFQGNLDELTIHGMALTAEEVAALYDYQVAWFDVSEEHLITVDAVAPTVEIGVSTTHLAANPDAILSIAAVDDVSSVDLVEYRVNGGAWQAATPDQQAWVFTFNASNGEGDYTIEARATDTVGNQSASSSVSFTVDNSAPSVTLDGNSYDNESQLLTLNGTIADIGGAGVLTSSVEIDILDVAGLSVSGYKVANVYPDVGSWTLDYPFSLPPYGEYRVQVIGSDALGNRTSATTLASVTLDAYPPFADVGLASLVISDTTAATVEGVLNTLPVPGEQRAAHFHFEETSLANGQVVDSSGNFYHATCDTSIGNCPTTGQTGTSGQAFSFDGVDDALTFDTDLDPSAQDFTAMAWFNVSNVDESRVILQKKWTPVWLGVNTGRRLYSNLGGTWLPSSSLVTLGQWHHAAFTYDGTTTRLYLDGILQSSSDEVTMPANEEAFFIGTNYNGGLPFNGLLDEVTIYNRALSADELYDIANPLDTQVDNLNIRYRHASGSVWAGLDPEGLALYLPFDGDSFSDMSVYNHQFDCTSACPATKQAGKEGYGLLFDGVDDYLESDFTLDPSTSSFSAAAWVKVDEHDDLRQFLQQADGTGTGRTWLGITGDKTAYTWLGGSQLAGTTTMTDQSWHHIALTYEQDTQQLSLYLDGLLENSDTRSLEASDGTLLIGSNKALTKYFPGALDELLIYQRALSADEVNLLANTTAWHDVSLDNSSSSFTTWSATVPTEVTDGPYKLDLWATDVLGNQSNILNAWTGEIDTHAPTVSFSYSDNGDDTALVSCEASDYNLTEEGWVCPVSTVISETQQADWYQQIFSGTIQLSRLYTAEETVSTSAGDSMTACDTYGHCTTADASGTTTTSNRARSDRKVANPLLGVRAESTINNLNLTLSVEGTTLTAGDTVDMVKNPTLVAEWAVGASLAGAPYQIQWQAYQSDGSLTIVQSDTLPIKPSPLTPLPTARLSSPKSLGEGDQISNSYQAEEAQKLRVQVTATLTDGREVEQSIEPIYVDYGTTPVYVDVTANNQLSAQYTGWLENSCNLIGQDHRHADNASSLSTLDETQQFYTSWDENGLRLNWSGADWRHDGDLFIYLDTKDGGSVAAYNPYPATEDNVLIFQPVDQADNQGMTADYMVWVRETTITETVTITDEEDGSTSTITRSVPLGASLMAWDNENEQWTESEGEWNYHFDHNSRHTDIYLPFELLGITDPTTQGLSLVALASEEDRLKLWSTMPHRNNVNSEEVIGSLHQANTEGFMLLSKYTWSNLAPDSCPSGTLRVTDVTNVSRSINVENVYFNGADLHATLTASPDGLSYTLFDNHLIDGHTQTLSGLCDGLPDMGDGSSPLLDISSPQEEQYRDLVAQFLCARDPNNPALMSSEQIVGQLSSTDYPFVGNGQAINYHLTIANQGEQAANNVTAFIVAKGALILPEGSISSGAKGEEYVLVVEIENLAPGEEETITFDGLVDTNFSERGQAKIAIKLYDETGSQHNPSEHLLLEHAIDKHEPNHMELQSPSMVVAPGEQRFSGFVDDESDVPTITLEINQEEINCTNSTPAEAQWSCPVTLSGMDGDLIRTKVKAQDEHGLESRYFDGPTLVVDTTSPTLTLSAETTTTFSGTLVGPNKNILTGEIEDNRLVERVEVCDGDECEAASVTLSQETLPQTSYSYADIPETAITIDSNNSCTDGSPLVRTFNVTDTFTIADLDVGLTLAHHFRNDIEVRLKSPLGTESQLIDKASGNANFDILLDDSGLTSIERDTDLTEHDISSPYYENVRQPNPNYLHRFHGEPAEGTWTLSICDKHGEDDDGEYLRSELFFEAQVLPENTRGSWEYTLDIPSEVETLNKSLLIVAYDSVGNRSEPVELNFTVDNRAPELAISEANIEHGGVEKGSELLLAGTISDTNNTSARLIIRSPNNQLTGARIEVTDGEWAYSDTGQFTREGTYCLWIEGKDRIGNKSVLAPLALEAFEPQELYLPLMSSSSATVKSHNNRSNNNIGPYKQYLPMIASGESISTLPLSAISPLMLRFVDGSVCE